MGQGTASFLDKLLFLARSEVGAISWNSHRTEIDEFLLSFGEDARALSEDKGIHFQIARNDKGIAKIDPSLIRQVLLNLMSNALNVTPQGGMIIIRSSFLAGAWHLALEDSGCGLPEDKLAEIFEPFVRVRQAGGSEMGSGLGLAICRSIITLHGGRIWAENRNPGPGLRVAFEIPRAT